MAKLLIWETPEWNGEVEQKDKRKKPRKVHVSPARFENRREAVAWCRQHRIPTRSIRMTTVER